MVTDTFNPTATKEHVMSYPSGPGGYVGPQVPSSQGYAAPQAPGYGAPPGPGKGLPFFLNIGVIVLGVLSFALGWAPYEKLSKSSGLGDDLNKSTSFFESGGGSDRAGPVAGRRPGRRLRTAAQAGTA